MNIFRSHLNRIANNGLIVQQKLRTIHEALLQCLDATNALAGKNDYTPGRVHLLEDDVVLKRLILLRLGVSRDRIEIFWGNQVFPNKTILKTYGGKYQVLNWLLYEIQAKKEHLPYESIPGVLEAFESQLALTEAETNIQFSLVS